MFVSDYSVRSLFPSIFELVCSSIYCANFLPLSVAGDFEANLCVCVCVCVCAFWRLRVELVTMFEVGGLGEGGDVR